MQWIFDWLMRRGVCSSLTILLAANFAFGAELRTSSGDRAVVRNASFGRTTSTATTSTATTSTATTVRRQDGPNEIPEPDMFESGPLILEDYSKGSIGCELQAPCDGCFSLSGSVPGRYWASVEFLLWWRNNREFPALVTTNPNDGVLPGATVLFGGDYNETPSPGGRVDVGLWFDPHECLGAGVRFFAVGDGEIRFAADSSTFPLLARPFFDSATGGTPTAQLIASNFAQPPTAGSVLITGNSDVVGGDVYIKRALYRCGNARLDFLVGYQTSKIDESISIHSQTLTQPNDDPSISVTDTFATENEYHAGYFGLAGEFHRGCWSVEMMLRFAFGNMHEEVDIRGSTRVQSGTTVATRDSGLLAQQATNAGVHSRNEFAFMEDVGLRVSYRPVRCFELSVGYSLMFWSNVVRPGDQINLNVDSRLFPEPTFDASQPAFEFDSTHFIVHGLTLGGELRF